MRETIGYYREELQRTAWREAYHQRKRLCRERNAVESEEWERLPAYDPQETERSVYEWIDSIPFDKGREVMESLFLQGKTEAETADMMRISQQGVNKWKHKSLEHLRRTLNS
ncbi:RNA polymerase sigma factor [Saccharibacillus qingshengii]|uniref:RNA polymerase sigma factor n=1 Tax=Saccharibacillus qingshengii TaxID=1763540 RepID=UPI001556EFBC|nr:hypothetical protein [Saccharibacillus qingshengii]